MAINFGNSILAGSDPATGKLFGACVDLTMLLGQRLGVEVKLMACHTAAQSLQAVAEKQAPRALVGWDEQ
jgi:hypothetical protein